MSKYISRSEKFLRNHNPVPLVTPGMAKGVSGYRRDELMLQVKQGEFRDGDAPLEAEAALPSPIYIPGIKKTAETFSSNTSGTGAGWRGSGGTVRQIPEIYSPLLLTSNINLPRDRSTINAWCRSYFTLNPYVRNAILLHSTYPISKLNIKCKDEKKKKFFESMIEEIDLENACIQIAQEYWLLGEAFPYLELNENTGKWQRIIIQNPDYISVQRSVSTGETTISLRPDENLRRIVSSNRPSDVAQRQKLNPLVVEYVRKGQNIPLDNHFIHHLANKIAPYEIHGTGLPVCIFKSLMGFDKIKECKYVQADDMINPISIWKIGGPEFKPNPIDLEAWREVIEQATYDKNFKIITHEQVNLERKGAEGIYDTTNDIAQLIKEFYVGLLVPSVLMDGGGDITYQNGGVSLDILRQRYMQFRNMMTVWLRRKVFAPISRINDYYEYVDGEKVLIVPDVDWNHMAMFDMGDYIQQLGTLATGDNPKISLQTLFRSLGLDWEEEKRRIRQEKITFTIWEKEHEVMKGMKLNELRSITPDKEINEPVGEEVEIAQDDLLPGEVPAMPTTEPMIPAPPTNSPKPPTPSA